MAHTEKTINQVTLTCPRNYNFIVDVSSLTPGQKAHFEAECQGCSIGGLAGIVRGVVEISQDGKSAHIRSNQPPCGGSFTNTPS